ncbi:hypothetical protein O7543_13935 [Solwaraspora sp. WMMA2080]|uniref:hypothetical protein n=1 Tax=unclassified Solwaraspora TaxID=2627926 RepID=UPI00248AD5FD|nr:MULTISPECIES: hypothetical protein [unclassified Solwaraspora]WBC00141.1 hypothetical protein O7553_03420 [Solwaraspora sp. WMMA2059]WBC23793.1 hypothetical protein O7543_13935 [Solwaraspora sp. WMMA2080]
MEAARRDLDLMRESAAAWPQLRYEPATGADGYVYDRHAARRAALLWAMQYDRRADDLPLLRMLAEQEAVCRRSAPFQGLTEETELAGFLLAEHARVEDVWLHWQIKRANFDTWCGYDVEHLAAAGVQATVDFVRASVHPDRADVLERLLDEDGQPCVSEDDLVRWAENARSRFPADPADEDPLQWIERAKLIGDTGLARRWLDDWAAGRERDASTLGVLRYQLADLGTYALAAQAQRESLRYADTDWERASAWQSLAELERLAGDHRAAWQALGECRRALADVSGWTEVGLGRMYVEQLFLLACSADDELAGVVFAEADRQAGDVPRLPLVVLRAASDAADKAGDQARAEHYRRLRDAEQQRIDGELGRSTP